MIYILSTTKSANNDELSYGIFDTYSESTMTIGPNVLWELILSTKIQVVNASIKSGEVILKNWANGIAVINHTKNKTTISGPQYTLLGSRTDNTYKIVDYTGDVHDINEKELIDLANSHRLANCNSEIETTDVYKIQKDEEFEKSIKIKYNNFIAKTTLLGLAGIAFKYEIENQEVKLSAYTGSNKDVILPPFITAIMKSAFRYADIHTIKLNEGLKSIGEKAFAPIDTFGNLKHIEIPSTVEIVGKHAFMYNTRLIKGSGATNTDRFKLLNNKTVVLQQFYN